MNLKHLTFNKIFLDEVESTNSFLIDLNRSTPQVNGTIVVANHQTKGKGQRGNVWIAKKGENLTFSTLIFPDVDINYSFYLNIVASLAVNKTLKDLNLKSKIKWPNDILVNDRKIAGILIENSLSISKINQSVIGIGLNVNQVAFDKNLIATSLKNEGVNVDKVDVLEQIYKYLDFYYDLLLQSNFDLLLKLYYNDLFWFNETNEFLDVKLNKVFKAKLIGIDSLGKLKLKFTDNKVKLFDLKEVKFLIDSLGYTK